MMDRTDPHDVNNFLSSTNAKMAINILIVSQYFCPENFKINDLAKGLVEKGYEITILTGLPNYPQGRFFKGYSFLGPYKEKHIDGYTIYRCPLIPRFKGRGFQLAINYLSFVLFGSIWALFLSNKRFDKIFIFGVSPITLALPAILIKKIKKIPLYIWVLDLWPESLQAAGQIKNLKVIRYVEKIVKFIYLQCDYILISSPVFESSIRRFINNQQKTLYFPQWAEKYYYPIHEDPLLPHFDKHTNYFKLIFAGNIGEAQSFGTLIKAAERLKNENNIHWYILGDGRKKMWAQEEIKRLNLENNFHFLGSFPPEKMSEFFYYADGLIVSLKKTDIFALTIPAKIQSYLACAKPILASLDGIGAKIIEENQAGFCSPAEDAEKLVQNILKLSQLSKEEKRKLGEASHRCFQKYFEREQSIIQLQKWLNQAPTPSS